MRKFQVDFYLHSSNDNSLVLVTNELNLAKPITWPNLPWTLFIVLLAPSQGIAFSFLIVSHVPLQNSLRFELCHLFFFSIKIFFLGDLIQTHGFKYHLYSDDSQNDNFSPELKIYTSNFYLSLRWVICISKLTRLMANIPCPNQLYFSKWNSHLSRCSSHKLKHSLDFPPSHTGTVC